MALKPTAQRRARIFPAEDRALVWFVRNRFALLEALVEEAESAPVSQARERRRFARTMAHARRVLAVRLVVTVLLAFGLVASVTSAVLAAATVPGFEESAAAFDRLMARVAATATSMSAVLFAARLALDRALARYDTVGMFLAARLQRD